ncbi:hypothetical protein BSKO_00949 [Bryopsis sp. KO-2023]|nr:hypothetical protein BSKO_00949 [Bryopsis sp. KO-2023]
MGQPAGVDSKANVSSSSGTSEAVGAGDARPAQERAAGSLPAETGGRPDVEGATSGNSDTDRPSVSKSEEELDREVEEALACPCVADLRDGPCGSAFVSSFSCFLRSTETEKGMDCLAPFEALQECMIKHPEEFADFIKPNEDDSNEEPSSLFPDLEGFVVASTDEKSKESEKRVQGS